MKNLTVQFKVKQKKAHENGFALLSGTFTQYPTGEQPPAAYHNVVGTYFGTIDLGDEYELEGHWEEHEKFGWQFLARTMKLKLPQNRKERIRFLVTKVKGVGKKTAQILFDNFGDLTFNVITESPEKLNGIEGVSEKAIQNIKREGERITSFERNSAELNWLSPSDVLKLIELYGNSAADIFKQNPYKYADIIGFEKCELSAFKLNFKKNDHRRVEGGIMEVLINELKNGHLYTSRVDVLANVRHLLNSDTDCEYRFDKIILSLDDFANALKNKENSFEIIEENGRIYLKMFFEMENKSVKIVSEMNQSGEDRTQDEKIREFLSKRKMNGEILEEEQEEAVFMTVRNRLSVLTGGPGTGKTHTANAIIQTIRAIEPHKTISLAAPTGKAAKKMAEVTKMESKTLHSLIGIKKEEMNGKFNKIEADYVIIDEASMVDISLFYALLSSIQPHTKILFIGDHNQLPSVGPGLILRDLIESGVVPVTRLKKVHRQSQNSQIIKNAYYVLNGVEKMEEGGERRDFYFFEREAAQKTATTVLKSMKKMIETGYRTIDDIQVITPQNGGTLGVDEMNSAIQRVFNPKGEEVFGTSLRIGDKVIHTENNADLDVKNGEVGKIVRAGQGKSGEQEITVDFGDKEVVYTDRFSHQLKLAYALTVHKMQGSEVDVIIMIISKENRRMLSRSILYTALTRGKERVVLIGEREMYFEAIRNVENTIRRSGIREKLQKGKRESA